MTCGTLSQDLLTLKDEHTLNLKHFTPESKASQLKGDIRCGILSKILEKHERAGFLFVCLFVFVFVLLFFVFFLGDFFPSSLSLLHNKIAPLKLTRNNASITNSKYFCSLLSLRGQATSQGEEDGGGKSVSKVGVGSQHTCCLTFRTHSWPARSSVERRQVAIMMYVVELSLQRMASAYGVTL